MSAIEFKVPAVPELMVALRLRVGDFTTTVETITGVPVLVVVPVAFVMSTVVVVLATIGKDVPLLPVAPPVYPEIVTAAPIHPLEPAPDSDAARV